MITEVTKYVVDGGQEFDTIEEAQRYERNAAVKIEMASMLYGSNHLCIDFEDCTDVAVEILKHYDVKKRQC